MPFQKGRKKTGGRKAGGIYSLAALVRQVCAEERIHPARLMARFAKNEKFPPQTRALCAIKLLDRLEPALSAVQHSGPGGGPIQVEPDFSRLSLEQLRALRDILAAAEADT